MLLNRRAFALGAAGVALALSGCTATGAGSEEDSAKLDLGSAAVDAVEEAEEVEEAIEEATFAVAMVTDVGGVDDESFNQSAWEGLQQLALEEDIAVSYFESAEDEAGDALYAESLAQAVEMGNNLVWGIGYATADAVAEAAEANPTVSFAVIDNAFDEPASNLTGVTFRAQEACFAVGYIAARCSETRRLGFVGGISSEALDAFEYGFRAGAAWAGAVDGAEATVAATYTGSFDDEDAGRTAALALYEGGCDVVFHAAGNAGNGVIAAAVEVEALAIGVDTDQYSLAPEHLLTSALKRVDEAVQEVSAQAANGEAIGGINIELGATEGAVGISEHHDLMADDVYEAALELIEAIKLDELVPPASAVELQEFVAAL